jgi:copper chaperone CopZ
MQNIDFKLTGLTCEACVKLASRRLQKIQGVREVQIDLKSGETRVSSDNQLDLGVLAESLADTNYSIVKS